MKGRHGPRISWNMPSNVMVDELYNHLCVSLIKMCGIMNMLLIATNWIMTPQLLPKHHCSITLLTSPSRHAQLLGRTTWNARHSGTGHGNAKTFSGGLWARQREGWPLGHSTLQFLKFQNDRAGRTLTTTQEVAELASWWLERPKAIRRCIDFVMLSASYAT